MQKKRKFALSSNELSQFLQYLTNQCLNVSRAGAASLFLANPERTKMVLTAASGYYKRLLDIGINLEYEIKEINSIEELQGIGLTTYVASLGRKLKLKDLKKHIAYHGKADNLILIDKQPDKKSDGAIKGTINPHCTQLVAFPLMERFNIGSEIGENRVIGVLKVERFSDDEEDFSENHIKQFESICEIAEMTLTLYWYNSRAMEELLGNIQDAYSCLISTENAKIRSKKFLEKIKDIFKAEVAVLYRFNKNSSNIDYYTGSGSDRYISIALNNSNNNHINYDTVLPIDCGRYKIDEANINETTKIFCNGDTLCFNSLKSIDGKIEYNCIVDECESGIIALIKIPPLNEHFGIIRIESSVRGAYSIFHQKALEIMAYVWAVNMYETMVFDEMLYEIPSREGLNLKNAINYLNKCTSINDLIDAFVITTTINWGAKINRCLIFNLSKKEIEGQIEYNLIPLAFIGIKGKKLPGEQEYLSTVKPNVSFEDALSYYRDRKKQTKYDLNYQVLKDHIEKKSNRQNIIHLYNSIKNNKEKWEEACEYIYLIIGELINDNSTIDINIFKKEMIFEVVPSPISSEDYYLIAADNTFIDEPATSPLFYGRFLYLFQAFKECLNRLSNELALGIIRAESTSHELSNVSKYLQQLVNKELKPEARKVLMFKAAVFAQNFNQILELSRTGNYERKTVTITEIKQTIEDEIERLLGTAIIIGNFLDVGVSIEDSIDKNNKVTLPLTVLKCVMLLLCSNTVKHGFSDQGRKGVRGIKIAICHDSNTYILNYKNSSNNTEDAKIIEKEYNKANKIISKYKNESQPQKSLDLIKQLVKSFGPNDISILKEIPTKWECNFSLGRCQ